MIRQPSVLAGFKHPDTKLTVLQGPSGWYVGFKDKRGAPLTRESQFFRTKKGAVALLGSLNV